MSYIVGTAELEVFDIGDDPPPTPDELEVPPCPAVGGDDSVNKENE